MRVDFDELLEKVNHLMHCADCECNKLKDQTERIDTIMMSMQEPIERLKIVDETLDNLQIEIRNKVSLHDLYNQLKSKAAAEKVKTLEQNLVSLNDFVNQMPSIYADKIENDVAHQLLQKNMKNLYDLFVAMKSDMAGADDPLFTTKGLLNCASCAKGVTNMSGYRAENVNWDQFPQKDPTKRMLKSGMGFSKMFH